MSEIVIITGASRGIGAATARLLGAKGFSVVVNYSNSEAAAQEVVADVERSGGRAIAVKGDVGTEADVVHLFEETKRVFGTPTGLVNNAGIVGSRKRRIEDMDVATMTEVMRINVIGSMVCAREAIRRMSTQHGGPGGSIVNLSSVAARLGGAGQYVDYAASKGAIDTFTMGLAKEVATEGIRVNGVRPGLILTDIHASGGQPDRAHQLANQVPMQRPGTADEVAQAVVWLLSDAA